MGALSHDITGLVVVGGGACRGAALVTDQPLSFWGGVDPRTGEVIDRHHPLSGLVLAGRILLLPHGRGSCSTSGVLLESIRNGTAPAAIVTTRVDPIIALGSILGDELYARPLPVLVVAPEDAATIVADDLLVIDPIGTIRIDRSEKPGASAFDPRR